MSEQFSTPEVLQSVELVPQDYSYEVLKSAQTRTEYITQTDELIRKMIEGHTDVAVFLDKSARPVAWLVRELWDRLARDGDDNLFPMPEMKFLNIDREQWGAVVGRSEEGGIEVSRVPNQRIAELSKIFSPIDRDSEGQSLLESKNVLVVDSFRETGDTLYMAPRFLGMAYPEAASIRSAYWMSGDNNAQDSSYPAARIVNTSRPVWFSEQKITGRLVANRDSAKSALSDSERQREGKYWLSSTFDDGVDAEGLALKREIAQLAEDLRNNKLAYMPSPSWDISGPYSIDDRITKLNDGISVLEYIGLRQNYPYIEDFIGAHAVLMASHKSPSQN